MKFYLKDLVTIKGGKRLPKGIMLCNKQTSHPYVTVKNLSPYKTELSAEFQFVPDSTFSRIPQYTVKAGDVVISIVGTIGKVSIIGESLEGASLTENCAKLIPNSTINYKYLYYFLSSNNGQGQIKQGIVGTTQPKLPFYNIGDIIIDLPSLEVQRHIVGVIGSIDDLIEKDENIIKKLDCFAQQLFEVCFHSNKQLSYRLCDLCSFVPGYSYTGDELQSSSIGMVSIKVIDRNGGFKSEGIKPLLPVKDTSSKKCILGDVLVSHTDLTKNQEIIGRPIIVTTLGGYASLTYSMDLVKVDPAVPWLNRALLYRILASEDFKRHALGFCTGTTVVHLSRKALETYEFKGPEVISSKLSHGLEYIQKRIEITTHEIENLNSIKELFLAKYFA